MIFLASQLSIGTLVGILVGMLAGITVHEFSHAFVADQLGDRQPRALGRVSLNPLRHLDPLGTALLVLVGIGWGKPVPVRIEALRNGRGGFAIVSLAGPVANVLVALVFAVTYRVVDIITGGVPLFLDALYWATVINLLLALLNLLPIPPLDGSGLLLAVVPPAWEYTIRRYQGFGIVILLVLLIMPGGPLNAYLGLAEPWADLLCGRPPL
ncbi:MAG TPA: site-2 protease family protein [Candidatus Limnocylindria bacterium]